LDFLKRTKIPDSALINLTYGSLSRIIAGQILMPFTVLKINQEVSESLWKIFANVLEQVLQGTNIESNDSTNISKRGH